MKTKTEFLFAIILLSTVTVVQAEVVRTPTAALIHHVTTTPIHELSPVDTDADKSFSDSRVLMSIDPAEVITRHPETIPQGTTKPKAKLGASSNDVMLNCFSTLPVIFCI